jgi:hypothetical protein
LVLLQENLIDQTTNPHVTRIRGAPCKRRMKNGIEIYKTNRIPMQENTSEFNQTKEDNQMHGKITTKMFIMWKIWVLLKKMSK